MSSTRSILDHDIPITWRAVQEVATHLGPDWIARVCTDDAWGTEKHRVVLAYEGSDVTLEGLTIEASSGGWRYNGQWRFTACIAGISMNVSPHKTPAQLAKELERRVLAEARETYRAKRAKDQAAQEQRAADNALAEELHAGYRGRYAVTRKTDTNHEAVVWGAEGSPTLRVNSGSVRVEYFTMTPDQARQFVALVHSWHTNGGA
jgi:hypothetical protein